MIDINFRKSIFACADRSYKLAVGGCRPKIVGSAVSGSLLQFQIKRLASLRDEPEVSRRRESCATENDELGCESSAVSELPNVDFTGGETKLFRDWSGRRDDEITA